MSCGAGKSKRAAHKSARKGGGSRARKVTHRTTARAKSRLRHRVKSRKSRRAKHRSTVHCHVKTRRQAVKQKPGTPNRQSNAARAVAKMKRQWATAQRASLARRQKALLQ